MAADTFRAFDHQARGHLALADVTSGLGRLGLRLGPAQMQSVFDYLADGELDAEAAGVTLPRFKEVKPRGGTKGSLSG
eukprot:3632639-Pyramimonas_sp.AAC.1